MAREAAADHADSTWINCGSDFVTLRVVVRPGVSRKGVVRVDARGLVIALNSRPEHGKANDELVEYLARTLKLPRSAVTIVRGGASRYKIVRIATRNPQTLVVALARLEAEA